MGTFNTACTNVLTGEFTLVGTSAQVINIDSGPCKRVRLMAPVDASGAGTNTKPVFYGDSNHQADWLAADGSRDGYYHIDNLNKIFVKGTSGEKTEYRVEY